MLTLNDVLAAKTGTTPKPSYYLSPPTKCDICRQPIGDVFIDGKSTMGPWGNMHPACHDTHGVGLGTGLGQKYERQADGRFMKVAG